MVASSLTGQGTEKGGGRGGGAGGSEPLVVACGRKAANSFPARERTSTFPVIDRVYLSFRNASIAIFQNEGMASGGGARGGRKINAAENGG